MLNFNGEFYNQAHYPRKVLIEQLRKNDDVYSQQAAVMLEKDEWELRDLRLSYSGMKKRALQAEEKLKMLGVSV